MAQSQRVAHSDGRAPGGDLSSSPQVVVRRNRGFTIIEIMIVLTIIGIITAFAIPRIDTTRYRIDSGMRQINISLMAAQRRAVSAGHDVVVMFDVSNNAIRILQDVDNDGNVDSGERFRAITADAILISRGVTPPHAVGVGPVTFTQTTNSMPSVTFHRNGSASEMGGFYLTSRRAITNATFNSDTRLLQIERATGRVSWFRYRNSAWERGF